MNILNKIADTVRYVSFKNSLCNQNIANADNKKYMEAEAIEKKSFINMYKKRGFLICTKTMSKSNYKKVDINSNLIQANENINQHSHLLSLYKGIDKIFQKSNLK